MARECGEAGKAETEITSEQELSDNDQGLEIFPDTSDTIKANGDCRDSAEPQDTVSDLQAQLAQMRLEIARMVEEAEERLDDSDITEEEEEEEEEEENYNWHLDYDASLGSESDAVENIEEQEFSYSDDTDQDT